VAAASPDDPPPIAPWMGWRNILSAVMYFPAMLPWRPRPAGADRQGHDRLSSRACALVYPVAWDRLLAARAVVSRIG